MTGPVRPATDPTRVTADDVQIVWDEEGPDGVADWIRGMAEDERAELMSRRSGIATAPPCTDGYWRNERHPPPPSAAGGENADPRETT